MPFPFLPGGALLAAAVLVGAFTAFALALRAMDRAVEGIRGSVLPGLVAGIRGWSPTTGRASTSNGSPTTDRPPAGGFPPGRPRDGPTAAAAPEIVELDESPFG